MPPVARLGDKISHGGEIITASDDTTADNIKVARVGDLVSCAIHGVNKIVTGANQLTTNNRLTARIGDKTECGASIVTGSPQRTIEDNPNIENDTIPALSSSVKKPPDRPVTLSPATETKNGVNHVAYLNNPSNYKNAEAAANGVKENYAGTPDTDGQIDPEPPKKCENGHEATALVFLQKILAEAAKGMWRETGQGGRPSNPNIINIWKSLGYPSTGMWASDQTAWCAGFVNLALKESGLPYVKDAGARNTMARLKGLGFQEVSVANMQPGDIVLWSFSHVNFCYTAQGGKYTFVGGNQTPDDKTKTNNPSDGSVTVSWKTGWTSSRGGIVTVLRPQCK